MNDFNNDYINFSIIGVDVGSLILERRIFEVIPTLSGDGCHSLPPLGDGVGQLVNGGLFISSLCDIVSHRLAENPIVIYY